MLLDLLVSRPGGSRLGLIAGRKVSLLVLFGLEGDVDVRVEHRWISRDRKGRCSCDGVHDRLVEYLAPAAPVDLDGQYSAVGYPTSDFFRTFGARTIIRDPSGSPSLAISSSFGSPALRESEP